MRRKKIRSEITGKKNCFFSYNVFKRRFWGSPDEPKTTIYTCIHFLPPFWQMALYRGWRQESTSYVLSFRIMVFLYLVITGWIFDIILCENSIKINQYPYPFRRHSHLDDCSKGSTGVHVSSLRKMRARAYNPSAWKGLGNTTNRNTPINKQVLDNFCSMITKALEVFLF